VPPELLSQKICYQLMCSIARDVIDHPLAILLVVLKYGLLSLSFLVVVSVGFHELVFEPSTGVPFKPLGLFGKRLCCLAWYQTSA